MFSNHYYVKILPACYLPYSLEKDNFLLIYKVSEKIELNLYDIVYISIRNRQVFGLVIDFEATEIVEEKSFKIKNILQKEKLFSFSLENYNFILEVAQYTFSHPSSILKLMLPLSPQPWILEEYYGVSSIPEISSLSSQKKIYDFFHDETSLFTLKQIKEKTRVSSSILKTLIEKNILQQKQQRIKSQSFSYIFSPPVLSQEQKEIMGIYSTQKDLFFKVWLLFGVPGSGKTEVYFHMIDHILQQRRQVLVLIPEIALTQQWLDRFKKTFSCDPLLWHSSVSEKKKREVFQTVVQDNVCVIVGARSSLFLPYKNLGLIVVDEEHEGSFKQERKVIYHGRDMAVLRAKYGNIPIILSSGTPSLESMKNALEGKYHLLILKERFQATYPQMHLVNLRKTPVLKNNWISDDLKYAMLTALSKKHQIFLFLNRRGYAPLTVCQSCGERLSCLHCTAWLVYHKRTGQYHCHYCFYAQPFLKTCPKCEEENSFLSVGLSIERLEENVKDLFPAVSSVLLSGDDTRLQLSEKLKRIEENKISIIIATQIFSKGFDYKNITCVGLIQADSTLVSNDLRAYEKTFQLLSQTAGRAGRGEHQGHVYLQTAFPDTPVFKTILQNDYEQFVQQELKDRKTYGIPPFGKFIALVFSCENEQEGNDFVKHIEKNKPACFMGSIPAPLYKISNRYRWRFLIRTSTHKEGSYFLKLWLKTIHIPSSVHLKIDVDPLSFL